MTGQHWRSIPPPPTRARTLSSPDQRTSSEHRVAGSEEDERPSRRPSSFPSFPSVVSPPSFVLCHLSSCHFAPGHLPLRRRSSTRHVSPSTSASAFFDQPRRFGRPLAAVRPPPIESRRPRTPDRLPQADVLRLLRLGKRDRALRFARRLEFFPRSHPHFLNGNAATCMRVATSFPW